MELRQDYDADSIMQVGGSRKFLLDDTEDALLSEIDEEEEKEKTPANIIDPIVDLYLDNIGLIRKLSKTDDAKHSFKSLRGKNKELPSLVEPAKEHKMIDSKRQVHLELAFDLQRRFVDFNKGKKLVAPLSKRITKTDVDVISAHIL